ncbi:MAG: ribbon-helix-helix protein, CopG family [Vicinamibacterales bacterium]
MTPKKLHSFFLDPELAAGLKAIKDRVGTPEAETVRRALREYLEKEGVLKTERKRAATRKRP